MSKYVQMGFEAICRPPRANYDDDEVPNFIFIANMIILISLNNI